MNRLDTDRIAAQISYQYKVDVKVKIGGDENGTIIDICPGDLHASEGFIIRVRLGWRNLTAEFIPGNFAGPLINTMAKAGPEKKSVFKAFATSVLQQCNGLTIQINDAIISPEDFGDIPDSWSKFSFVIKRFPVVFEHNQSHEIENEIIEWGGRAFGMAISLLPLEEVISGDEFTGLPEGALTKIEVNRYERNLFNRTACIKIHGTKCKVCDFNFAEFYGPIGEGFIHVHHVVPVSKLGSNYVINPAVDLIPVCPNCHAMLHSQDPPLSVESLRKIIK